MKTRLFPVLAIVVATFLLFVPVPRPAVAANVMIQDNVFSPSTITINAGDSVVWTNGGAMAHTVTADDNSYDSGTLNPGATFSHVFNFSGTYRYYCRFHGAPNGVGMSGTVIVVSGNQTSTPTPTTTAPPVATTPPTTTYQSPAPSTGMPSPYIPANPPSTYIPPSASPPVKRYSLGKHYGRYSYRSTPELFSPVPVYDYSQVPLQGYGYGSAAANSPYCQSQNYRSSSAYQNMQTPYQSVVPYSTSQYSQSYSQSYSSAY